MIETQGLRKTFGKVTAVADMTFAARDGAITTLLGGNGSGKTTTLRMIAGLIRPDAGRVHIDGQHVAADRVTALARTGVLHDEFGLYPRLTSREHLEFSAELSGLTGRRRDTAVDRAIALLEIGALAERRVRGFSHGQRMKVALARALVHSPKNVILDEPTRGLDIFAIRLLRRLLQQLRSEGSCIVLSSHALAEVVELSDSIIVIDAGRVRAIGTTTELTAQTGTHSLEAAFVALVGDEAAAKAAA